MASKPRLSLLPVSTAVFQSHSCKHMDTSVLGSAKWLKGFPKVNTVSGDLITYSFSSGIGNCCPSQGHNQTNLQENFFHLHLPPVPSTVPVYLTVTINVRCIELCSLVVTPSQNCMTTGEILMGQELLTGCWRNSEAVEGREGEDT